MATVQYLLVLCVLAGTLCLAQLDAQSLGAVSYTDCGLGYSQLTVSNITLYPSSPCPTSQIYLIFNVTNPTATDLTVSYVYWTLSFSTPLTVHQYLSGVYISPGTTSRWSVGDSTLLNQTYSSGWIPFQLVFYSDYSELACWEGSVYVTALPNPFNCSNSYTQLNLSFVSLHIDEYNQSSYLTFNVENIANTNAYFQYIYWFITLSSGYYLDFTQDFSSSVALAPWESVSLSTESFLFPSNVNISWYEYQSYFSYNGYDIACWYGYQAVQPSPPNPPGNSLIVSDVALDPFSPSPADTIYLMFNVTNPTTADVTVDYVYWTLNFSTPLTGNQYLSGVDIPPGETYSLSVGNSALLNQTYSSGWIPFQLVFYSDYSELEDWEGSVYVTALPNPSNCSNVYTQLNLSSVLLHIDSYNQSAYLTFNVENIANTYAYFNSIFWLIDLNSSDYIENTQDLSSPIALVPWGSVNLITESFQFTPIVNMSWYDYELKFYYNWNFVACWYGYMAVQPSPPNPPGNSLIVSDVALDPFSPSPADTIYLMFNVTNPTTADVTVDYVYWTLNFSTPLTGNQYLSGVDIPPGETYSLSVGNSALLNQTYSSGWIPFQLVFYSDYSELEDWEGSVYVTALPNPSNCSNVYTQLNLSFVLLHIDSYNQSAYLTFNVENIANTNAYFNYIEWLIYPPNSSYIYFTQDFSSPIALAPWGSVDVSTESFLFTPIVNISWYDYEVKFYYNGNFVACWCGYMAVQTSPPNPPGCFNDNSLLSVNNVVLHPSWPQIHDSIYLTFEIDNWSDVNVTFSHIYYILTFNPNSPIAYNLTLPDLTLPAGEYIGLAGKKFELNQSVSSGTYPYQFAFYSNSTTEVGCWGGNVTIRNEGDCLGGRSKLKVANVILNPNSPQIYDPVNLTFTVENESGKNVAFNSIYWTLTFTPGSPLRYNLTLGTNVILVSGTSLTLNGNSLTLYESVSEGTYPYQLEFYENSKKIACWGGEIVVPSLNPSLKTSKTKEP